MDLFKGIGNPVFEVSVRELGAVVHSHRRFPITTPSRPESSTGSVKRAALTTAKDAARLEGLPEVEAPGSTLVLDVEMEFIRGAPILDALLDALPPTQRSRERASIHEGLHG